MKILVDARMMGPETSRGIGRVIRELLQRLLKDSTVEWVILVRNQGQLSGLVGSFKPIISDIPWYGVKEQIVVPWIIIKERPNLVFFPHWNIPVLLFSPFVCFIHDLILFHHPDSTKMSTRRPWLARLKLRVQHMLVWLVAHRARRILTPTQFVADDFARYFSSSMERIAVVGEGISELPAPDEKRLWTTSYFLTVGGAYPHKRLDLVLDAWKTQMNTYPDHTLIMVGEQDVFRQRLMDQAKRLGLERVQFPGKVDDQGLATWLAHADALIFPSEDEGFGLPPLEALSFSCPVLASDIPCLKEVLPTEGVVFFRNGDLSDMIGAWNRLYETRAFLREETKRGFIKACMRHDWDRAAQRVRQAFSF